MNQLQLSKVSKEIIRHAEETLIPEKGLAKAVDDYFIQHLKQDEMQHATVDAKLYEGLRTVVKAEVLPLYEQYRQSTARIRERKQRRKVWQFVLGTVVICEFFEALLTRGRSIAPQVLIPTAILYTLIGFILYTATQYIDDLHLARARKRLEKTIEGLENKVQVDVDYDNRRELLDAEILRSETMEIVTQYEKADDFWRDYLKVREADPTVPSELKALAVPAFEKFLHFHVRSELSEVARQHRFNRLFIEANEIFVSRDREKYAVAHLKNRPVNPS